MHQHNKPVSPLDESHMTVMQKEDRQPTEDERLDDEMSRLQTQFPNKRFRITKDELGRKFVEVVLDW